MSLSHLKGVSLRGLEVFESLARTGSVAATASEVGLSAPAVSQQIKNLSAALGVELVDHARRPMSLTPAGRLYLTHAEAALGALRAGQREITSLDLTELASFSLGVIDDLENEVTPRLAQRLSEAMSQCAFVLKTGASHALHSKVATRELDMAICAAATPTERGDMIAQRLLSDPYILAVPKGVDVSQGLGGLMALPFLRRDLGQIMGQQIESYLQGQGFEPTNRFELESNQSISALVASGSGWTITTALSLLRGGRFLDGIDAHSLPGPPMLRQITLFAGADWSNPIPDQLASLARELISDYFVEPGHARFPWLRQQFHLLSEKSS